MNKPKNIQKDYIVPKISTKKIKLNFSHNSDRGLGFGFLDTSLLATKCTWDCCVSTCNSCGIGGAKC